MQSFFLTCPIFQFREIFGVKCLITAVSILHFAYEFFSTSTDFNECSLNNAGCEHICSNNEGSFNCDCRAGFKLKADKMGCEGKVLTGSFGCSKSVNSLFRIYYTAIRFYYTISCILHCKEPNFVKDSTSLTVFAIQSPKQK